MPPRPGITTVENGSTKVAAKFLLIDQGADGKGKKEVAAKKTEFGPNGETLPGEYEVKGTAPGMPNGPDHKVSLTRVDH